MVKLQNQKFKLYASPWSAPAWMKTNDQEGHGGHLINNASYYQTWSNYFVR
jgi:glucosylceramidase